MKALYPLKDEVDVEKAAKDTFDVMVPAEVNFMAIWMVFYLTNKWNFRKIENTVALSRVVETIYFSSNLRVMS